MSISRGHFSQGRAKGVGVKECSPSNYSFLCFSCFCNSSQGFSCCSFSPKPQTASELMWLNLLPMQLWRCPFKTGFSIFSNTQQFQSPYLSTHLFNKIAVNEIEPRLYVNIVIIYLFRPLMLLLTNLKVNVFKAFGSSTIFCKLAATVKERQKNMIYRKLHSTWHQAFCWIFYLILHTYMSVNSHLNHLITL